MSFRSIAMSIFMISTMSIPVFSIKTDTYILIPQKGTNGKWGYVDTDGNFRIKPNYEAAFDFKEGFALVSLFNKFGYIDPSGKPIISLQYDGAKSFSDGLAAVMIYINSQKKWGYIDKTGRFVIFPRFDEASDFTDGRALVKNSYNEYFIDKSGNVLKEEAGFK